MINYLKLEKISELIENIKYQNIIETENLTYNKLDLLWKDFVAKEMGLRYKNEISPSDLIELSKQPETSIIIESIFLPYTTSEKESLIMVYKKGSPEILYYIKSYNLLKELNTIELPYFTIRVPISKYFLESLDFLKDNEIIFSYI